MDEPEGVAIARLQEQLRALQVDVTELVAESKRARQRLHKAEGATDLLLANLSEQRDQVKRRQDAILRRQNYLLLLVAALGLLVPVVVALTLGH